MVPMVLARAGFNATGKFRPTTAPDLDQFLERRQDTAARIVCAWLAVIEFFRRAEDPAHIRVGLEEREEDRDALDNAGLDLGAKELPVLPVPILDAIEAAMLLRPVRLAREDIEDR